MMFPPKRTMHRLKEHPGNSVVVNPSVDFPLHLPVPTPSLASDSSSSTAMGTPQARRVDGLKSAASSDPECGATPALFSSWGKVRKTPYPGPSKAS